MKAFDRYLGQNVALPERVEPGRFRLLKPTKLNQEIELDQDDTLLSDGRERCNMVGGMYRFAEPDGTHSQQGRDPSNIRRAIATISAKVRSLPGHLPSPLIPPEMADELKLNELDEALRRAIDHGHLDEIVYRPRYSMKYEAELVDISRVRRAAPGAFERLAARSEDWHRRTITTVLPKRLLTLLSDDDWSIYENKVFARLLDRLEQYLRRRVTETEELQRAFEEALKLGEAEGLDYRLRERLCQLWGEAAKSSESVTRNAIDESKHAIEVLRAAKRKIGLLRHSDLYRKVPRSACVPAELRHTNILNHDQHYRHLKTLWHLHQKCNGATGQTPEDVFRETQRELDQFCRYLQMMIRRVLRDIWQVEHTDTTDDFVFAGRRGCLVAEKGEIALRVDGHELVFIPVLGSVPQVVGLSADGSGRLIVSRFSPIDGDDFTDFESLAEGGVFSINPMDFYGEEKIRLLVERFLWFPVFKAYGASVDPLPAESLDWLEKHHIGTVVRASWCLLSPLSDGKRSRLECWLSGSGLNVETQTKISNTVKRVIAVGNCRHCGASAAFVLRDSGFKAECASCNTEWGIYSTPSGRVARMKTRDTASGDFRRFGSWFIEFSC